MAPNRRIPLRCGQKRRVWRFTRRVCSLRLGRGRRSPTPTPVGFTWSGIPPAGAETAHRRRLFRTARRAEVAPGTSSISASFTATTWPATPHASPPRGAMPVSTASPPNVAWRAAILSASLHCSRRTRRPPKSERSRPLVMAGEGQPSTSFVACIGRDVYVGVGPSRAVTMERQARHSECELV